VASSIVLRQRNVFRLHGVLASHDPGAEVTPSTSMSLRHSHQFKHVAARIFEVNASAAIATSPNPHAGGGGVMQGLIRFRQRRVLLPNHDTIRPIGRTNCKWPPLGKSFHIRTGLSRGERGLGETHPDWDFGCNGVSEIDVLRALQRSLMTCQRSTLSAAMLAGACPNEASAAVAAKHLKQAGFKKIRPLLGGIDAWVQAGQPVEHALASAPTAPQRSAT
jgi:hypothetical protein